MNDDNIQQNMINMFGLEATRVPEWGSGEEPPEGVYKIPAERIDDLIAALRATLDPALYTFDIPKGEYGLVYCRFTPECDHGAHTTCHLVWTFVENSERFYRMHFGRAIWKQVEDI